ncbi:hypothetical protein [Mesorhizobium sp. WSM4884]|uniref:hypothetical protein n=1 Tax=Mesorhizobium sp. WSM4884 TaxID=3038542 RepID=UPI002417FA4F|nr:hypothetical protein [Mesorhizobium sp. WSM4884]MDG4881963.1 hypothetical protein [Mesorhizobium sp. WSM4884]
MPITTFCRLPPESERQDALRLDADLGDEIARDGGCSGAIEDRPMMRGAGHHQIVEYAELGNQPFIFAIARQMSNTPPPSESRARRRYEPPASFMEPWRKGKSPQMAANSASAPAPFNLARPRSWHQHPG